MTKKIAAGTIITIIIVIAALIGISKILFPLFVILSIGSFIWLIATILGSYEDITLPAACFCGFLFLGLVTHFIGFTFGDSGIGTAITDSANAFNTISEVQKNTSLTLVDVAQNVTDQSYKNLNYSGTQQDEANANLTYEIVKTGIKISN